MNQDGVSQESELFTLESLNIQSLNTAYQDTNTRLGNGNSIAQKGSYTLSDGQTREMCDLLFANDTLHSRYIDAVTLTAEQAQTANVQGIGRLRNLREAAALSPKLAEVLAAYSKAETKAEQKALLPDLMNEWAKTDPQFGMGIQFARPMIRTENEGVGLTPFQAQGMAQLLIISEEVRKMAAEALGKIAVLDAFSGERSSVIYVSSAEQAASFLKTASQAYDKLADNLYHALEFQTRLKPYLNEIGLTLKGEELALDYAGVEKKFAAVYAENAEKAFVDLGSLLARGKLHQWPEGRNLLENWAKEAKAQGVLAQRLEALGKDTVELFTRRNGTDNDDVLQALNLSGNGGGSVSLYAGRGNDVLISGKGNDSLSGGEGSDTYIFGKNFGRDSISNYESSEGQDTVRFTAHTQNDFRFSRSGDSLVIETKEGADRLTVQSHFHNNGNSSYAVDSIEFSDGLKLDKAAIKKLVQQGSEQNDSLYAYAEGDTLNGLGGNDTLYGEKGNDTLNGGIGNDYLYGRAGNDTINGGADNDRLEGNDGDDTLDGGIGADTLYGDNGNDILNGGEGNDYLVGGSCSDTYIFAKGHGTDSVYNYDSGNISIDNLLFEGAESGHAVFSRSGNDLLVKAFGDGDQVTVQGYFYSENYRHADFTFADKKLGSDEVMNLVA